MKKISKILSEVLVVTIISTSTPNLVFAKENPTKTNKEVLSTKTKKEAKIIGQIQGKGEKYVKQFLKDDGTYEAAVYPNAVQYLKDGKWTSIDNTLIDKKNESNNEILENKDNDFKIKLSKDSKADKLVSIEKDKYELSWKMENINKSKYTISKKDDKNTDANIEKRVTEKINNSKELSKGTEKEKQETKNILVNNEKMTSVENTSNQVTYLEILKDVDLQYNIAGDSIKENIIIKKPINNQSYKFILTEKNLILKQDKNNNIILYDKVDQKKPVFKMQAPIMIDANNKISNKIDVKLQEEKGKYTLSITPDNEWINNSERKYPIVLDPPLSTYVDDNYYHEALVSSKYSSYNFGQTRDLSAGNDDTGMGITRSYMKFRLPTLTSSDVVTDARVDLTLSGPANTKNEIDLHEVTSEWNDYSITWDSQPSFNSNKIEDFTYKQGNANEKFSWNITKLAREWYSSKNNYGIMIKNKDENQSANWFYSRDSWDSVMPYLYVNYVNNSGVENSWTYHTQSVGIAGTSYLNDFNGNLVMIHNDLEMNGSRMPISLKHIYNASQRGKNIEIGAGKYGAGWRTSYNQSIKSSVDNKGIKLYQYVDEDGTIKYFSKDSSGIYTDKLGEGLELQEILDDKGQISSYTIKDKSNNKLSFSSKGLLTSITDSNNNVLTINYAGTQDLIQTIVDGAGRSTSFNYDSNEYLQDITDPSGRKTYFIYSENNLICIGHPNGNYSYYTYDSNGNLLDASKDDGYGVSYGYDAKNQRVNQIQEYNENDETLGGVLSVYYGYNTTYFTDAKNNVNVYQFDNSGKNISIRDSEGKAQYFKYGSGSNSNKLSLQSNFQKSVYNYIKNHNVEIDDSWIADNGQGSTGTNSYTTEEKYLGSHSLKIEKTNSIATQLYKQATVLEKGKEYTLSAYVKTKDISCTSNKGAVLELYYQDDKGIWNTINSKFIKGTSDWNRSEVSFIAPANLSANNTVYVRLGIVGETGTAYFDCIQLEQGVIANRYNIIENGALQFGDQTPLYWKQSSDCGSTEVYKNINDEDDEFSIHGKKAFYFEGSVGKNKYLYQDINLSGKAGEKFVVSGWGKADSAPMTDDRAFGLQVGFKDANGTYHWNNISFNQDSKDHQFISDSVQPDSDFTAIQVRFAYNNNLNYALFSDMELYKDEFGTSYNYDAQGNLTSTSSGNGVASNYQYANNDLVNESSSNGSTSSYIYDSKHNLTTQTSGENVTTTYNYDSYGNQTSYKVGNDTLFIKEGTTYSTSGNYAKTHTDSLGNVTISNYNEKKGTLDSTVDPLNVTTSYAYDSNSDQLTSVSVNANGTQITNSYGYENDNLKSITTHNGVKYNFEYDSLGNNTSVSVGTQSLIYNSYEDTTGKLMESTYGNGQKISYDYDNNGRIVAQKYNGEIKIKYAYDAAGKLGYKQDLVNNISYRYLYDSLGNIVRINDSNGNSQSFQNDYASNSSSVKEVISNNTYTTSYSKDKDGRAKDFTINSGAKLTYNYDILSRLTSTALNTGATSYNTVFNYMLGANGSQSSQVLSIDNNGDKIVYTYYKDGNIETITRNGKQIKYYYNYLKEVTREDNQELNKTIVYTYDFGGNLTEKNEYQYNNLNSFIKSAAYKYDDANWKDKLISFGGKAITYDAIGNPLTYDGYTYTWENGRQLKTIAKDGLNMSFMYNESGIRTEKTINGKTTKYILNGDKVSYETDGTDNIYYSYDSANKLVSMNLSGTEYYYIRNAQGDIIGLIDKAGTQVVGYIYDTWGKLISTTGTLKDTVGVKNPYLYRGYRYDKETGLYYLQSRYYNAEWGRFVNADDVMGSSGNVISHNLYAYCQNNPINLADPDGDTPIQVVCAIIGGVAGWYFGDYVARKLGLSGWKYWTVRSAVVVGGAAIGWFAGGLITNIARTFLLNSSYTLTKMPRWVIDFFGFYNSLNRGVNFSRTAAQRMEQTGRFVPVQTMINAIRYGVAKPDPSGSRAIMYYIDMVKNGVRYKLEVLYDIQSNSIWHFMYYRR